MDLNFYSNFPSREEVERIPFQQCRLLNNSEVICWVLTHFQNNIRYYQWYCGASPQFPLIINENMPFFISEKLDDPVNVVIVLKIEHLSYQYRDLGFVLFHLKVSNVDNISSMLKIFSTNEIPNCTQTYDFKLITHHACCSFQTFNILFTLPNKDVYSVFAYGTSWNDVHPGDKMFYSFKPINAKTDYYDTVSLLSYGEDNSEIIRNYEAQSVFHNPPFW